MSTKTFRPAVDLIITLLLWAYYFAAFVFFFFPAYSAAALFAADQERAFQNLNCIFYRCFFAYLKLLMPRVKISIAPEVYAVRSSVVIANHLSFLDPILLISLFRQHKTIVKSVFFKMPIFGWVLKSAGYLSPSLAQDANVPDLMEQVKSMRAYLASGGNLFIFPEGTRSRSGAVGPFEKGAFTIAKLCRAPIQVLRIENTHRVYPPDRFLFNTGAPVEISVSLAGSIEFDDRNSTGAPLKVMQRARALLEGTSTH
jgi:1-acyl-sn-glycerol-3-phosphate acyltransferase